MTASEAAHSSARKFVSQKAKSTATGITKAFKASGALLCKTLVLENVLKLPKIGLFTVEKKLGLCPEIEGVEIRGTPSLSFCNDFVNMYKKMPEARRNALAEEGMTIKVGEFLADTRTNWKEYLLFRKGESRHYLNQIQARSYGDEKVIVFAEKYDPTLGSAILGVHKKTPASDLVDGLDEETLHQVFHLEGVYNDPTFNDLYKADIEALGGVDAAFQKAPYYVQDITAKNGRSEVFANARELDTIDSFPKSSAWARDYQAYFDKTGHAPQSGPIADHLNSSDTQAWFASIPPDHTTITDVFYNSLPGLRLTALGGCLALAWMKRRDDFLGPDLAYVVSKAPTAKAYVKGFIKAPFDTLKKIISDTPRTTYLGMAGCAIYSHLLRSTLDCTIPSPTVGFAIRGLFAVAAAVSLAAVLSEGTRRPARFQTKTPVPQPE